MKDDHDKFAINVGRKKKLPHSLNKRFKFYLTHSNVE
jgi:hypothetical protein